MLNVTAGQFGVFLAFVWLGAMLAVFYDLLCPQKKWKTTFETLYILLSGVFFIIFTHVYNLGNFRLFLLLGMGVGLTIEKFFVSKTLAQLKKLLYNYIGDVFKNLINRLKLKKIANSDANQNSDELNVINDAK